MHVIPHQIHLQIVVQKPFQIPLKFRRWYFRYDSDAAHCASGSTINVQRSAAPGGAAPARPAAPFDKVRVPPAPCTLFTSQSAHLFSCRLVNIYAALCTLGVKRSYGFVDYLQ